MLTVRPTRLDPSTAGLRSLPVAGLVAALVVSTVVAAPPAKAIVDGRRTEPGERPWQVALAYPDGEPFCGGTLVAPAVVITAAHCTEDLHREEFVVVAGAVDLGTSRGQERGVDEVDPHPRYAQDELADIAVVRLDARVEVDRTVTPVPLATDRDVARADVGGLTPWLRRAGVPTWTDVVAEVVSDWLGAGPA